MLHHCLAQCRNDIAAQDDILLDCGVSEVEIAILETGGLIRFTAAVDLKRQLIVAAAAENLYLLGHDLDIAGGLLGIFAVTLTDNALDGNGAFLIDALYDLHHVLGLNDDLCGAVKITDDDESEVLADLTDILHPADDLDLLANMLQSEFIAGMCTGLCHN